jgi:hypothetical protein
MNPDILELIFIVTAVLAVWFLFKAASNNAWVLLACLSWMIILAVASFFGFFNKTDGMPPRIVLAPGVAFALIIGLFALKNGRAFLGKLDIRMLTLLHLVRIPVEITLYFLFTHNLVPEIMTFEGSNFDVISGITAPFAVLLFLKKGKIKRWGLLLWNLGSMALLANIVIVAALSVPSPLQQFGFEQPNVAILKFPYIWLPGIVVPIVLLSHLASIYIILKDPKK